MAFKDFEEALKRLEQIVEKLEKGDLQLEAALELFEEGVKISKFCTTRLDEAERKVEILIKDRKGKLESQPFSLAAEDKQVD